MFSRPLDLYRFESISTDDEFDRYEQAWTLLTEKLKNQLPTQRYDYMAAYFKSFNLENENVLLIACYRSDELVAVLPWRCSVKRVYRWSLPILEFVQLPMPIRDIIVAPNEDLETILRECGAFIQRLFPWQMIQLDAIPSTSPLLNLTSGLDLRMRVRGQSNAIDVSASGHLQSALSANFRNYLRRKRKKLDALGKVEFQTATLSDELEVAYQSFLDTEAAGWKSVSGGKRAVKLHTDQTEFYNRLKESSCAKKQAHIHLLLLNGVAIASDYCILGKGASYSLKHGYDEKYSEMAPGHLLRAYTIEYYEASEDTHTLDLVSSWAWHDRWHPLSRPIFDVKIFNKQVVSQTLYLLLRLKDLAARALSKEKKASIL